MTPLLALAASLASSATAAPYDPGADRAALRQAATACQTTVANATGLPLLPEKAAEIGAGLDEGLRLARLASDAALSLDKAAKARGAALEAAVKDGVPEAKIKAVTEPVAVERARRKTLLAAQEALKAKVEALPEDERKKHKPLLAKAAGLLDKAGDALAPLEDALKTMAFRVPEMRDARKDALGPLGETAAASAEAVRAAKAYEEPLGEAKARLGALGQEPRDAARARAWEKLVVLRDSAVFLFQSADRACNRADDLRRRSDEFEEGAQAFEKARALAAAGPAAAREFLDGAQAAQALLRERLPG